MIVHAITNEKDLTVPNLHGAVGFFRREAWFDESCISTAEEGRRYRREFGSSVDRENRGSQREPTDGEG